MIIPQNRTDAKNKSELEKLEKTRVDSMREFNRKREKLLNNRKEVKILGDLIMMNHKVRLLLCHENFYTFYIY